jgi:hypothetical protein
MADEATIVAPKKIESPAMKKRSEFSAKSKRAGI